MKTLVALLLVLGIAAAPNAAAAEASPTALQLRPKAALVTSMATSTATHQNAPFVMPLAGDRKLDLLPRRDERQEVSRSSCSGEHSLCYDPTSGHIVYKPARSLMPVIPGLQPENISLKRDRIVLRYSF
jgi:hypothetical protein